jgi:hypothetical protein
MSKVFISSTVFDLLDARAEVEQLLHDMRLVPVLSGSSTSAFQPLPDQNSIETCLANLRQCDAVIVMLCQRYGPSLKPAAFPDLSATHLEYAEAKKLGKPIRMYVRDRLEADYRIQRKNKKNEVQLVWVRDEKDRRLFDLMEEHQKLVRGQPGSNWYDTFANTVELKALIKRDFGPIASREELDALVVENSIPIIAVSVEVEHRSNGVTTDLLTRIRLKNVGTVPAYRLTWTIDANDKKEAEIPVLAPQQETQQDVINFGYGWQSFERSLAMTYYMPHGHRVADEFIVRVRVLPGGILASGVACRAKTYHVASGDVRPFVIAEPEGARPNIRGQRK